MSTSCLVCCEQNQCWILPPCNHKEVCWKCCLKLVEGSIFICPFCKDKQDHKSQLLFVTTDEMHSKDFKSIMQSNPFRSYKNSLYFYSNEKVAHYIESETSYHCVICGEVHETPNNLKRHISNDHRLQFCDVCFDNRKCIIGEQRLYTDYDLQKHLKEGELSVTGQVVLYHPLCQFCNRRFYDLDSFKIHLKMSSHLKCQICDLNCSNFKYLYYKNYDDLELHHRKTHFVCEVGDCINRKLENVFASEALLEDHKRRFHRKYRPDKAEKLDNNILLGFNKKEEDQFIEYDGIGRDLSHQFTIFDVHDHVQKQDHTDELIDLREFYPQQVRMNRLTKVDDAIYKLQELHSTYGLKDREPQFAHLPLYKPIAMTFLNRNQCQKLLRRCFSPRQADSLMELFFTKRFDFKSPQDWIQNLQRKMRVSSYYAFYVIFPQLIRNLRDQNKAKMIMDQFYCQKLHTLNVNRKFIFHELKHYSQLIEYSKKAVEEEVGHRLRNSQIELELYSQFLKEMNVNFYLDKQEHIYYVSKEKITHLYHMVEHCRTKDFLKLNWLLKVGLTIPTYELLKKFYYLTPKELPPRPLEHPSLQELALLKSYLSICYQSILDQVGFNESKLSPRPHYLTSLIDQLPQEPPNMKRQINQLRVLEGRSDQIIHKMSSRRGKGIVVDQRECPSLLKIDLLKEQPKQTKIQSAESLLARPLLPTHWNEQSARIKQKPPLQRSNQEDQFPTLFGSANKKPALKNNSRQDEEDFPVFNFKQKFVKSKQPPPSNQNFNNLVGFNKKEVYRPNWDEDRTRKKFAQVEQQTKESAKKKKNKEEKRQFTPKQIDYPFEVTPPTPVDQDQDSYLKQAIEESLKTAKLQEQRRAFQNETILPKKKIEEEEPQPRGKKGKKNRNKDNSANSEIPSMISKQAVKEQMLLFERIEEEQKKVERQFFRRDISQQKQKPLKKVEEKTEKYPKPSSTFKAPVFIDDDFAPLTSSTQQQSIITKIIKQQNQPKIEAKPSQINKQKGKKRKNRVDQSP